MSEQSVSFLYENALHFADDSGRHVCQHTAAIPAECCHTRCRSTDRQHADHTTAANSPVCVDRRTQTLRTRKTSLRLAATHNAGRRPQRYQWPSVTEWRTADCKLHTGKVTWRNKMADLTVPRKWRWHCRHISFTLQLHSVCVERRGRQFKWDSWKSVGESEIQHFVEPSRKVSCGDNCQ